MIHQLLDRRLLFFGGKGGVGKTTTAAATALLAARRGRRTLLVSTDPAHNTADILGQPIGPEVKPVGPSLWALEIDPHREAHAYLEQVESNMRLLAGPGMEKTIRDHIALSAHSPGAEEAALLDRMVRLIDEMDGQYDLIVFDTAPTGHTLRLLHLPAVINEWLEGLLRQRQRARAAWSWIDGARAGDEGEGEEPDMVTALLMERRRRFAKARRMLLDPEVTGFVLVLIPERLPIAETQRALSALREHEVPIGGLVVNRVLPEHADGTFLSRRRSQEAEYLREIDRLFRNYPRLRVPMLEQDVVGISGLEWVGKHLQAGA